jgi:hypothetical protein
MPMGMRQEYSELIRIAERSQDMSMREFIRENRDEIDRYVHSVVPGNRMNDEERRLWVLNDEWIKGFFKDKKYAG